MTTTQSAPAQQGGDRRSKGRRIAGPLLLIAALVGVVFVTKWASAAYQDWQYDRSLHHQTKTKMTHYTYPGGDPWTRSAITAWGLCASDPATLHVGFANMPGGAPVTLVISMPGQQDRTATATSVDRDGFGEWSMSLSPKARPVVTVVAHDRQGRASGPVTVDFTVCG